MNSFPELKKCIQTPLLPYVKHDVTGAILWHSEHNAQCQADWLKGILVFICRPTGSKLLSTAASVDQTRLSWLQWDCSLSKTKWAGTQLKQWQRCKVTEKISTHLVDRERRSTRGVKFVRWQRHWCYTVFIHQLTGLASAVKTPNKINLTKNCQPLISINLCRPIGRKITPEIGLNIYRAGKLLIAFSNLKKKMVLVLSAEVLLLFYKSVMRKLLYGNRFADGATCASLF